MDRLVQHNVLAMSGRSVEAAGDVDTLLLDKTGTITLGNRQATDFRPAPGVSDATLADAAQLASLADETPEGRSIVVLAKEKFGIRGRNFAAHEAVFVAFSAHTRMSGIDFNGRHVRKGAFDAIERLVVERGNAVPPEVKAQVERIAREGGTPLAVAENGRVLGVIHLKDIVKGGIRDRFAHLRAMGIKTVMITGDNPLTAAAIASEAGVDDFMAEATPEDKLKLIRMEQAGGRMVAMTGDGTNDAPALAQADVGVAMNTGTMAAKEAGNMVDLDSNPTKLIEIVEIGKQLLMTRGALTTFSIANDVAKYFAIIPAMFILAFPQLNLLNVMQLATPESAILSAVIFNAVIIIALIPLALRGIVLQAARGCGNPQAQSLDLRRRRRAPAVHRHQGDRRRSGHCGAGMKVRSACGTCLVLLALLQWACNAQMVLTQQVEARRLASELQVQFTTAADASNRAVMSDSDEAATAAVQEAEQATQAVLRDVEQLEAILKSMGYSEELRFVETFKSRFAEYQKLDAEILPLALENTNLKAQRLSFGPAREAATAFRTALDAAARTARPGDAARVEALAAKAAAAVLEIQVLQAPHIAESEDATMTRMEKQMAAFEAAARMDLERLKALLPSQAGSQLTAAAEALDRFRTINVEIISLSRRNSNVRSLALTLGRKRIVTAQCDDQLRGLREALSKHAMNATR